MAAVTWSPHTLNDLQSIVRDLTLESTQASEELAEYFIAMADQLSEFPYLGRVFPDANRKDVRVLIIRNHKLIYRVWDGDVEIARIIHGARRLQPTDLPL